MKVSASYVPRDLETFRSLTLHLTKKQILLFVVPYKINMEPENTSLEEENHLNQTIIFRFYVNLRGCNKIHRNKNKAPFLHPSKLTSMDYKFTKSPPKTNKMVMSWGFPHSLRKAFFQQQEACMFSITGICLIKVVGKYKNMFLPNGEFFIVMNPMVQSVKKNHPPKKIKL